MKRFICSLVMFYQLSAVDQSFAGSFTEFQELFEQGELPTFEDILPGNVWRGESYFANGYMLSAIVPVIRTNSYVRMFAYKDLNRTSEEYLHLFRGNLDLVSPLYVDEGSNALVYYFLKEYRYYAFVKKVVDNDNNINVVMELVCNRSDGCPVYGRTYSMGEVSAYVFLDSIM